MDPDSQGCFQMVMRQNVIRHPLFMDMKFHKLLQISFTDAFFAFLYTT